MVGFKKDTEVSEHNQEEGEKKKKSSFEVPWVTADGCYGGSKSPSGGGLKLKRPWFESPNKQQKSARIKENSLFSKPPAASLELPGAQLHWIFTGLFCSWKGLKKALIIWQLKTMKNTLDGRLTGSRRQSPLMRFYSLPTMDICSTQPWPSF